MIHLPESLKATGWLVVFLLGAVVALYVLVAFAYGIALIINAVGGTSL